MKKKAGFKGTKRNDFRYGNGIPNPNYASVAVKL